MITNDEKIKALNKSYIAYEKSNKKMIRTIKTEFLKADIDKNIIDTYVKTDYLLIAKYANTIYWNEIDMRKIKTQINTLKKETD